jgi:hypothetical protein
MKKLLVAAACVSVLVLACQKEIGFGEGTGNPAANLRCTPCSYLPVCDSTQLTYIDSSAVGIDTVKSTLVILGDTTISGTKYTRVTPSASFPQGLLYNCDGGNYRIYQRVPDLGIGLDTMLSAMGLPVGAINIPTHISATILKTGVNAGATWSDTVFTATPIPFLTIVGKLDYTLEAKNTQRTVLGKLFTNVHHVSSTLNISIPLMPPMPLDVQVDYYFADGVGIIETATTTNGAVQAKSRLYQYKIK